MRFSNFVPWGSIAKEALGASWFVFKGICVLHITRTYIFNFAIVSGPSMIPTLELPGNLVVVDRISPQQGKVGLGDVVLVRSPENPRKVVTKRLIGIEGECMTFNADPKNSDETESVVVPKGHVWVQGDNVYCSRDSRHFGPVPYALVEGRVCWRLWPGFGPL